ncbi:MAG: transposase [Oceanibaculum nanhaiense]|uniref:RNA-guided endonuclease InsQ/TnpB family protein n=1 Tax=Oceanibaculum nanhaiense TaxID=1909734 RepID=UPI0025A34B69|nr:transposase [Oceanibaculum nanhaiense]MDM7947938.1 transposase [Oceanibaculum nanhaiense]
MIQRKANLYRLYPTPEQADQLARFAGACRFVWNLALEQRRDHWRAFRRVHGRVISYADQANELPALKVEAPWLKEVPSQALQQALKDLDRAFANWFAGRASYPRPRKRGLADSFRLPQPRQDDLRRTGRHAGQVRLPKLGWVSLRGWRALPGNIRNITISRRAGHWYAAVQWEREVRDPAPSTLPAVGIDRGVVLPFVLSSGYMVPPLNPGRLLETRSARLQRSLARKVKFSANWKKEKSRLARLKGREAAMRRDLLHKLSTAIAKSHGLVVMENLKTRNMTASARGTMEEPGRNVRAKAGLNRSILDQGWHLFQTLLGYRLAERGGHLLLVDPACTSQTCSSCGSIDRESRKSQAAFACRACGHEENADLNAARNILRRGSPLMPVEEAGCSSDEAGTSLEIAA